MRKGDKFNFVNEDSPMYFKLTASLQVVDFEYNIEVLQSGYSAKVLR